MILSTLLFSVVSGHASALLDDAVCHPTKPAKVYMARYTSVPYELTGRVNGNPFWDSVPFSEPFEDIAIPTMTPRFLTNFKVRWDHDYVYVAGHMHEPNIWANLTEHNSVIFQDNDFEVFFDPLGASAYYKECEFNALAVPWNLAIAKPYLNGGSENSSRVYGKAGYNMENPPKPLVVATSIHPPHAINNPSAAGRCTTTPNMSAVCTTRWEVEAKVPIHHLLVNVSGMRDESMAPVVPAVGTVWRMQFSRVQYSVHVERGADGRDVYVKDRKPSSAAASSATSATAVGAVGTAEDLDPDNWVWAPMGLVNVHLPERWGFLVFGPEAAMADAVRSRGDLGDAEWPLRWWGGAVYGAITGYVAAKGRLPGSIVDVVEYVDVDYYTNGHNLAGCSRVILRDGWGPSARPVFDSSSILPGAEGVKRVTVHGESLDWEATVTVPELGAMLTVRSDRRTLVRRNQAE